jgi:putative PIN family toxin of toxin-antitoxin system
MRLVLDTNVLVSMLIRPGAKYLPLIDHIDSASVTILYSPETLSELIDVLGRDKFAKYTTREGIAAFVAWIAEMGELVTITREILLSPDPKDNKFLSLAVSGSADMIVSGDKDHMIALGEVEGIPILRLSVFLSRLTS